METEKTKKIDIDMEEFIGLKPKMSASGVRFLGHHTLTSKLLHSTMKDALYCTSFYFCAKFIKILALYSLSLMFTSIKFVGCRRSKHHG